MEIKFNSMELPCLMPVLKQTQCFEETQEFRLSDGMPDIASVLCAWGQVLMRGKEWRSGQLCTTGGVMVWVLYMPEDGDVPEVIESWVPFQARWDFQDPGKEGKFRSAFVLRNVDARMTSARKLMLRAVVGVTCEAWVPETVNLPTGADVPADVYVRKTRYPVTVPVECGEKMLTLDEEFAPPDHCPKIEKILRYELQTNLSDRKTIGTKAVFRGVAVLKILYQAEDGQIYNCSFEMPVSQYSELDGEYSENGQLSIWPAVTNLEIELEEDGSVRLRCGITAQYVVFDRAMLDLAEDGYCIRKKADIKMKSFRLPVVLDSSQKTVTFENSAELDCKRIADASWQLEEVKLFRTSEEAEIAISGKVQILYYDQNGNAQCHSQRTQASSSLPADNGAEPTAVAALCGNTDISQNHGEIKTNTEVYLDIRFDGKGEFSAVEAVDLAEVENELSGLPSLILKRACGENLWELAKKTGSSVEAIQKANQLQGEPEADKLLLIPVLK